MKALLEFNLDEIEDKMAHQRAIKSLDLCLALWDIQNELRSLCKYGDLNEKESELLETLREKIYATLDNYEVSLDRLIL